MCSFWLGRTLHVCAVALSFCRLFCVWRCSAVGCTSWPCFILSRALYATWSLLPHDLGCQQKVHAFRRCWGLTFHGLTLVIQVCACKSVPFYIALLEGAHVFWPPFGSTRILYRNCLHAVCSGFLIQLFRSNKSKNKEKAEAKIVVTIEEGSSTCKLDL